MQGTLFESSSFEQAFVEAYKKLNTAQKEAVDRIEGPVMVIAGPGTGKTQVLAVRIGKILKESQVDPHNILCLTFTDTASLAMRKRLVEIIGPAAHRVHMFTFHAFCNQVIREHMGLFGRIREIDVISELEKVEALTQILNELPEDHTLKKLKGIYYNDINRLDRLFSLMKKENLDAAKVVELIDQYLEQRRADLSDKELYYQVNWKGHKKGELKTVAWERLVSRMEQTKAGALLMSRYEEILRIMGRYDYQDMILWVVRAFEKDDWLLAGYQERYQYVLVDEFQDTNGSQKRLLDLLMAYWSDNPNLFVVGDDDQAIFKFQGANLANITEINEKYNPQIIVLEENYRSTQNILDGSKALIEQNTDRLVNQSDGDLSKNLIAANPLRQHVKSRPVIFEYPNPFHEKAAIVKWLTDMHQQGVSLKDTAIIYRNHKQVEDIIQVLDFREVPYSVKNSVDILSLPLVRCLLVIMTFLQREREVLGDGEDLLFKIMHYHFFHLRSEDVGRVAFSCGLQSDGSFVRIRSVMGNRKWLEKLGVSDPKPFLALYDLTNKWISDIENATIQVLFQSILNEGGILAQIMSGTQKSWHLQVITTFFDFIKEESSKRPDLDLKSLLNLVERMKENRIGLNVNKVVHTTDGASLMTAHSAKGMEFEKVLLIGANSDIWDKLYKNNSGFKLPDSISQDTETDIEDERRLFFVAMTRAKTDLSISYSATNERGKSIGPSRFIDELRMDPSFDFEEVNVSEEVLTQYQAHLLSQPIKAIKLIDADLVEVFLNGFKLSVTALNKYLRCPLTFYFETVLRVPTARTKYMGFGKAIHDALRDYHEIIARNIEAGKEQLMEGFQRGMKAYRSHFTKTEYEDMYAYGIQVLEGYYHKYLESLEKDLPRYLEVSMEHAEYEGVPLKGFLDKVEGHPAAMKVTDYKTGNIKSTKTISKLQPPGPKNENGGDYWRQIVFYKILANSDRKQKWNITEGCVDFIEPDSNTGQFKRVSYIIRKEDEMKVGEQIKQAWRGISNHEFDRGCDDDDCRWCNFAKNDFVYLDVEQEHEIEEV